MGRPRTRPRARRASVSPTAPGDVGATTAGVAGWDTRTRTRRVCGCVCAGWCAIARAAGISLFPLGRNGAAGTAAPAASPPRSATRADRRNRSGAESLRAGLLRVGVLRVQALLGLVEHDPERLPWLVEHDRQRLLRRALLGDHDLILVR